MVDWTLRRRGGGEIGASRSSLRLGGFVEEAILRRALLKFSGNEKARAVLTFVQEGVVACSRLASTREHEAEARSPDNTKRC